MIGTRKDSAMSLNTPMLTLVFKRLVLSEYLAMFIVSAV